jgi:hypothetical protein
MIIHITAVEWLSANFTPKKWNFGLDTHKPLPLGKRNPLWLQVIFWSPLIGDCAPPTRFQGLHEDAKPIQELYRIDWDGISLSWSCRPLISYGTLWKVFPRKQPRSKILTVSFLSCYLLILYLLITIGDRSNPNLIIHIIWQVDVRYCVGVSTGVVGALDPWTRGARHHFLPYVVLPAWRWHLPPTRTPLATA